jgi:hypothetical protein
MPRQGSDQLEKQMQASTLSRSTKLGAFTARLSAGLGLLLVLALGHTLRPSSTQSEQARVHVKAELRVGDERPASVADITAAQASLRALNARLRSTPHQSLAAPTWFSSCTFSPRLRSLGQDFATNTADRAPRRAVVCSWPLPRSICQDSADDAHNERC